MRLRAFVIGTFVEGDVNVERFEATVLRLGYDFKRLRNLSPPQHRRDDGDRDLVLFCVGPGLQSIRDRLEELRARDRQVIVYADPRRASPHSAVEYCHAGLADDYLVWGEPIIADRVEEHVKALFQNGPLYRRIDVHCAASEGEIRPRVFIATPYDRDNRTVMSDAVDPALKKLDFEPCWADAFYRDTTIPEQVMGEIRRSAMLIANIRQGEEGRHNPNVYYEAGQARGLGKPVLFVRPLNEKDLMVPADIGASQRIEYDNPTDLSMRLYHGLR